MIAGNELSTIGATSVRRAYGNWTKPELRGCEALLQRARDPADASSSTTPRARTRPTSRWSSMRSTCSTPTGPRSFGIVSSDSDFTPLVMHLRDKGCRGRTASAQARPAPSPSSTPARASCTSTSWRVAAAAVDIDTGEPARDDGAGTPLRAPAAKLKRDAAGRPAATPSSAGRRRERLGARRRGRPADRQPGARSTRATTATRRSTKLLKATELFAARPGRHVRGLGARHRARSARAKRPERGRSRQEKRLRGAALLAERCSRSRQRLTSAAPRLSPAGAICAGLAGGFGLRPCASARVLVRGLVDRLVVRAGWPSPAGAMLAGLGVGLGLRLALGAGLVRRRWTAARPLGRASPAGASVPALCARPSRPCAARGHRRRSACAKAPCENTAMAAATALRASLVFIG